MFFFLYLIYLIFNNTTTITFLILIFQSLLMTILGGYALGNYVMKNNYSSKMLMLSSICFGINLFVLGVKFYYLDLTFLKPISMVFFIGGHLAFLKFVLLSENEQTHKDSFIL